MYDIKSLAYGFTTEQAHVLSLPLKFPICIFDREATFYENYYQKIDFWWYIGRTLASTDVKIDRNVNRYDDESSDVVSTAEFVGISGHPGSILGKADHMDLRYRKTSFKKFKKINLVKLCHNCQLNDPQEPIKKYSGRSIPPNLFYYRVSQPEELLFNFLWEKALEIPHHSYDIPEEFMAKEERFLDYIKAAPKTLFKMNDYRYDLSIIKELWNKNAF
jgi:hypothetical protein